MLFRVEANSVLEQWNSTMPEVTSVREERPSDVVSTTNSLAYDFGAQSWGDTLTLTTSSIAAISIEEPTGEALDS